MRIYDGDKILDFVARLKKYIKANPESIETEGKTLKKVIVELQEGKSGRALNAVTLCLIRVVKFEDRTF